jgi:DNA repair exonuclease SbcCD ATPase subunit
LGEGDAVVTRLRQLLRTGERDWGIAAALWSPQGQLALPELSGHALADIQRALGAQLLGPDGARIEEAVRTRYHEYFTGTGRWRSGRFEPRPLRLQAEYDQAQHTLDEIRQESTRIEQAQRQLEEFQTRLNEALDHQADLRKRLEDAGECSRKYQELEQCLRQRELERRTAEAVYHQRNDRRERIAALTERAGRLRQRLAELSVELAQGAQRIEQQRAAKEQATELLWRASAQEADVRATELLASQAERFAELIEEGRRFQLDWTAAAGQTIAVRQGDPPGEHHLPAGQTIRLAGRPGIDIEIAGVGHLRVVRPGDPGAALLDAHPEWQTSPPDPGPLREQASKLRADLEVHLRLAQDRISSAGHELSRAESDWRWLGRDEAQRREELAAVERELDQLTAGSTGQERLRDLDAAALACHGAEAALRETRKELGRLPEQSGVQRMERELAQAGEEAARLRDRWVEEQALLRRNLSAAPHQRLALAEERLLVLQQQYEAENLQAQAVRLLWNTIEECRGRTLSGLSEPVSDAASQILARIAGRTVSSIQLSDRFAAASAGAFSLDELSGGETEQIWLATRLALAGLLSRDERQLVVLDDVLTATDPGRLDRILELIRERCAALQFLILTCHPDRYHSLREARFFDVEQLG